MKLIRRVVRAIIVTCSLLAIGASYANADGGGYAVVPSGTAVVNSDPGDPGLPPGP